MPASRLDILCQHLLQTGLQAQDDEEARFGKNLLNLAGTLFLLGSASWLLLCAILDAAFPLARAAAIPVLAAVNFALLPRHGNFPAYRWGLLSLLLLFPILTQWQLGPLPATSGLALWGLLAPLAALFSVGTAASTPWFLSFLILTALAALGMPQAADATYMPLHVAVVAAMLYPLLRFSVSQRSRTRQGLADTYRQLSLEQERSERLLQSILPAPIAARLKQHPGILADGHPEVVVMFADIVNYTRLASDMPPPKVFEMLNRIFCRFDELTEERGLERIKTIGDGYMVAGGLHANPNEPHAAMGNLALAMQAALRDHQFTDGLELELRIGIASGPVVGGVVGRGRFIYDLWGDTVNLAHRLCTEGEPSVIQCDGQMFERLQGRFVFAKPVLLFLKGKGYVPVYRLHSPRIFAVPQPCRGPSPAAAQFT